MLVTIWGPNVPFADGATFHVHRADCHDLTRRPYAQLRRDRDQGGYDEQHTSKLDIVTGIYPPEDFCYDETNPDELAGYLADVHIFPCVTLPDTNDDEPMAASSGEARNRRGETYAEAWTRYHAEHPEVLASWAEQNGRWPESADDPTRLVDLAR